MPHWVEYMASTYCIETFWPKLDIDPIYYQPKTQWFNHYCQIIKLKLSKRLKRFRKKKILPNCTIIINNDMNKYLLEILKFGTNNENKKKILDLFPNKNENNTVIELITHINKFNEMFDEEDIANWLCSDNKNMIKQCLSAHFSHLTITVIYDSLAKGDCLNPQFEFS